MGWELVDLTAGGDVRDLVAGDEEGPVKLLDGWGQGLTTVMAELYTLH